MSSNKELLQKADWAVGDLSSNGGLLNPEQANTFIRKLLVQPTLLRQVRRVVMSAPERKVNKIQFNKRILRAATSATALSGAAVDGAFDPSVEATLRAKPITEQITLQTKEVIAQVNLPYDLIEDNIERGGIGTYNEGGSPRAGGGIVDTILTLVAERAALDLEELAILGDTTLGAADPYLDLVDGYLKRLDGGQILNAAGAPISRKVLTDGMKLLPSQYRRNRAGLMHFTATEQEIDYRETIAQRETATGDSQTTSTAPVFAAGAPVSGVALMPNSKGILTNPLNLLFGIQRNIHFETDKDITSRQYIVVVTARVDFQVEETEAAVRYDNLGAA
jgi:hypothetical protein